MRHRKAGVKLNRSSSHRKAMFRNMVTSLFKHDRIKTTDTRAKELSRWADHIITLAKRGDLHARRQALAIIREKDVVHKIFEEAKARFGKRNGGYTRVVKLGRRPGDAALISVIELISAEEIAPKKKKKTKAAPKKAKAEKQDTAAQEPEAQEPETVPEGEVQADAAKDDVEQEAAPEADDAEATAETAPPEQAQESTPAEAEEAPEDAATEAADKKSD